MGEPQEYNAQAEMARGQIAVDAVKVKIVAVDPADVLFRPYDRDFVKTDLTHWMTFLKKDRLKKIEKYALVNNPLYTDGAFPDKAVAADARRRYLLMILYREVLHGDGSPEVAQSAFNALFPPKG